MAGKKKKSTKETIEQVEKNIYKRGECSYQVKMMIGGYKINETFDHLNEAQAYRDLKRAEAALDHSEGQIYQAREKKRLTRSYTLAQAIKKYRTDVSAKKKGSDSECNRLDLLERLPSAQIPLSLMGRDALLDLLNDIRSGRGQQHKKASEDQKADTLKRSRSRKQLPKPESAESPLFHPPRPVTEGTVKRYYNLLHHIFESAIEWKKIDKNPCVELKKTDIPKDNKRRDRRLKGDEYELLLEQLTGEARVILILAVETAMRRQEFLGLQWENIKFKGDTGIAELLDAKTGGRLVPLSKRAVIELRQMKKNKNVVKMGGPVFSLGAMALRYQWRKAREAIGAPDLRIHDLRHQAASAALENGLTIAELMLLTGHKDIKSLQIYLQARDIDEVARKL